MEPKTYRQGLASAKAGKGLFQQVPVAQRVEYYHRQILLARLFAVDEAPWVLKGGTALVWRDPTARATKDIDVFNKSVADINVAVNQFKDHLARVSTPPSDVHFDCEIKSINEEPNIGGRQGAELRVHLVSSAGRKIPNPIKIDLVVGCAVTGEVETRANEGLAAVLGAEFSEIKLYPVVDHLADKVAATMSVYSYESFTAVSTRVRDLVDIVQVAMTETIDGTELWTALESERQVRKLAPFTEGFVCPDSWKNLYESKKLSKGNQAPAKFAEALAITQAFLNPAISGEAAGKTWRDLSWH